MSSHEGDMDWQPFWALPKVDLHRHLEGSLRLESLVAIGREYRLDVPAGTIESLRPFVQVTHDPPSHISFLQKFETLRRFYCSPEVIYRLAYEAVADAANDNVRYLELRFSPQALARVRNFRLADVTDWVIGAAEQSGRDHHIQLGLIISLVRHEPAAQARQVAEIAFERAGRGIVGLDLAGDEVNYPAGPFRDLFWEANRLGLGTTTHAGEWLGAESVRYAIETLQVRRIGHGVRAIEEPEVINLIRKQGTTLEICLTSNIQTGVSALAHHPLPRLLAAGLPVTLNTDDPAVSNITLSQEYAIATRQFQLKEAELEQMTRQAIQAAFLPPAQKQELLNTIYPSPTVLKL